MSTDYNRMAACYDAGRNLPPQALLAWREPVRQHISHGPGGPVLDLGSGTGIFSGALATWLGRRVFGVEPSEGMRRLAVERRPHADVRYLGGSGEAIPLGSGSCGAAWLSTVVHHMDLPRAAAELRRVLRPEAPVLVRNAFAGRSDGITWLHYFPSAGPLADRRWPTVERVTEVFEKEGFHVEALQRVAQPLFDLRDLAARVATRVDSTLNVLPDEEFREGLARLEGEASRFPHRAVTDYLDLLVLR